MSFKISDYIKKPVTISSDSSISEVCSMMLKNKTNSLLVLDGKTPTGIISDRQLYSSNISPTTTKASTLQVSFPIVNSSVGLDELLSLFTDSANRMVMVRNNGNVLGIIDEKAIIRILLNEENSKSKKLSSLNMDSNATIQENQSISVAISKLKSLNLTHLLVLSEDLQETGVVSTWDISTKVISKIHQGFSEARGGTFKRELNVLAEPVKSIFSNSVVSLSSTESVHTCLKTMQNKSINSVAIFDDGVFLGFATLRRCINAVMTQNQQRVFVFGLKGYLKPLSSSIESYSSALLDKWNKKNEVQDVYLHVKSFEEGNKLRFLVHARAIYNGKVYSVSSPERPDHYQNWDVYQSVKESMDELSRVLSDQVHSVSKKLGRKRDLKYSEE